MMKNMMAAFLAALMLVCPLAVLADGEIRIDGTIEATSVQTVFAPHSGRIGDFTVRAGDELAQGEALFTLSAQKIYADFDGTITGVFSQPGDSTAAVQDRYGALCYMEYANLYSVNCSTSGAYSDNENRIVHVGEKVYIRSMANSEHEGVAIVTSVDGKRYTLEVTQEDGLRLESEVRVYRDPDYHTADCIGTGTVHRIDPQAVTGEGYVRAVHVEDGQAVKRGDLLFELVPDALEDMQGGDGIVNMPKTGVLLSVLCESGAEIAKDAPMATFCEQADMLLVCPVDEEDLEALEVGMQVTVTLDAYRAETLTGTVTKIAGASAQEGASTSFDVTIRLEESDRVRVGMNATAEF